VPCFPPRLVSPWKRCRAVVAANASRPTLLPSGREVPPQWRCSLSSSVSDEVEDCLSPRSKGEIVAPLSTSLPCYGSPTLVIERHSAPSGYEKRSRLSGRSSALNPGLDGRT